MYKFSISGLATGDACPRKFKYSRIDQRIPAREDDALSFGRAMHKVLEVWHQDGGEHALDSITAIAGQLSIEDICRITALTQFYDPPVDEYRVVGTEVPFETTLQDPDTGGYLKGVRFRGVVDLVLEDKSTGELIIVDHKTTSQPILGYGPYWASAAINDQFAAYARVWGAHRVVVNAIKKPTIRLRKNDTPEDYLQRLLDTIIENPAEYYQWREYHKTEQDLEDIARSLCQRVRVLRRRYKDNAWPMHPQSCQTIYGACSYLDVCSGQATLDDPNLFMDREYR